VRTADHASVRAARRTANRPAAPAKLEPRLQTLAAPPIHPDLPPPATLPDPDQNRAALSVKVALAEGERFADPQSGAPKHDNHGAEPNTLTTVTSSAHHGDDLLHRRRVRRIPKPLLRGERPW
jgi:hypothetical protein